jgi:hypothetical protein
MLCTSVVICVFRCTKWRVFGASARGDRKFAASRRGGEYKRSTLSCSCISAYVVVIATNMIDEDDNLTLGFGLKIVGKGFMNCVVWCTAYEHCYALRNGNKFVQNCMY